MADSTLPVARAEIDGRWLTTTRGVLVFIPAATIEAQLAAGVAVVELGAVGLHPGERVRGWLTVSEAGREMLNDVDGMTFVVAKGKISRACTAGQITSDGTGRHRRIEPTSFAAWRLAQRERADARDNDEPNALRLARRG